MHASFFRKVSVTNPSLPPTRRVNPFLHPLLGVPTEADAYTCKRLQMLNNHRSNGRWLRTGCMNVT